MQSKIKNISPQNFFYEFSVFLSLKRMQRNFIVATIQPFIQLIPYLAQIRQ